MAKFRTESILYIQRAVSSVTEDFREEVAGHDLEEGTYLRGRRGEHGEIVHVDEETVRVEFNPELAGERLEFEMEILGVE